MTSVGIIGSEGFLAKRIINKLSEKCDLKLFSHSNNNNVQLDLLKLESFDFSNLDNLDYLLFPAAISSLDICENDYSRAYSINVLATKKIIEYALSKNVNVIFFSSDAVYGYSSGKALNESDEAHPISAYGKMKKEIEDSFKNNKGFKSIRLSYVFSYYDKFTQYYLKQVENKVNAEIFHPFYRNVITANEVIEIINILINNWEKLDFNILNVCGNELISRIRIVDTINLIHNWDVAYDIIDMPKELAKIRPNIMQMESLYLKELNINSLQTTFENRIKEELIH